MNDKNQLFAMCAGIAALFLVLVMVFTFLPGSKRNNSPVSYPSATPSSDVGAPAPGPDDSIKNTVKTPDANSIKASVIVAPRK